MKFFKTRVFIAIASFLAGMAFMGVVMMQPTYAKWRLEREQPRPYDPFAQSMDEVRRLQEEMMKSLNNASPAFSSDAGFGASDLKDEGDHYTMAIDLNGLKPENFSVQVQGTQLTLEGRLSDGKGLTSQIQRSFPVPDDVQADLVQIETKGDRLVVTLPKKK